MLDRQDLDALLVGALYGELTPADSQRLAQHLESHPGDKVALDDMTRARQAVQESRIFAAMSEPPQAVSALLLQEAHRRAPRSVPASDHAEAGWFHRFLRSFAAHPAMAAATMLVLVAGVAGTLYVRNGQVGAEEKIVSAQAQAVPASPTLQPSTGTSDKGAAASVDPNAAAGSAGYAAQLDETVRDSEQKLQQDQTDLRATTTSHVGKMSGLGVTVHRPEPTVKDLPGDGDADSDGAVPTTIAAGDRPSQPKAPAHAAAPPMAPRMSVDTGGAAGGAAAPETRSAPAPVVASPAPPPPPSAAAAQSAPNAQNGPGQGVGNASKAASDASLVAWADQQKARVIQLVNAHSCYEAADAALAIQNRAPDYYNQNVANDRTVQKCASYISEARARQADEVQKRASSVNAADPSKK